MPDRTYRALFLSRRNSARSVMAAAILNKLGAGKFQAVSAAVQPAEAFDPYALHALELSGYQVPDTRPRHFREFAEAGAADLDFVFTLSDTAAGETPPEWPGLPVTAHWSSPDPVLQPQKLDADWERRKVFAASVAELERRLRTFVALPFASLDRLALSREVEEIGQSRAEPG